MDVEVMQIKKGNSTGENQRYQRLEANEYRELLYNLNSDMAVLYNSQDNLTIEEIANKVIENIYYVLEAFGKMGLYPGYFFHVFFEENINWRKVFGDDLPSINSKKYYEKMNPKNLYNKIRNGLNSNAKYAQLYHNDIGSSFVEMASYFQSFNIPYNISINDFKNKFDAYHTRHYNITEKLSISDDIIDDVELLTELLYEYLYILVEIGVNPKEKLDALIEEKQSKSKSK